MLKTYLKASLKDGKKPSFSNYFKLFIIFVNNNGKIQCVQETPYNKSPICPMPKPLTINIIKVFLTFIHIPPLLPPNGIYK